MIAVQKVQVKPDTYDSKNPAYTARLGPCTELWRYGAQYGCAFMRLSSASPWTALGIHEDDVVLYVDDTRVFDAKLLTEKTKSLFDGKQSALRLAIDRNGQFYEITASQN